MYNLALEQQPHYTAQDFAWSGEAPDGLMSITAEQAKKDINLLLYALDHAYGGKDFIKPQILAKAKKQLQNIPETYTIHANRIKHRIQEALSQGDNIGTLQKEYDDLLKKAEKFGYGKYKCIVAASLSWLYFFFLLWLGIYNMQLASVKMILIILPMAWIEHIVSILIARKYLKPH